MKTEMTQNANSGDNALDRLKMAIVEGPMNMTAYRIFKCIQEGYTEYAKQEYFHDGDKIEDPLFASPIKDLLGCRLHGVKVCGRWPCNVPRERQRGQ